MTNEAPRPDTRVSQPSAPGRKSSGCAKAVVIVGGLTLLMLLVCAGIVGGIAWSIWPTFIENRDEIAATGKQILDVTIPPEFEPATGFKMTNFAIAMQMAAYRRTDDKGSLILGSLKMKLGTAIQKPEFQSKSEKTPRLKIGETKVIEFEVRGQKVPFRFSDAVEQDTDKKYRVVEAEFESDTETKFFKLILEDDVYDEAATIQMIESIR